MSVSVSSKVAGNRLYQHMQNLKKVEQAISPSVFNVFRRASIEICRRNTRFLKQLSRGCTCNLCDGKQTRDLMMYVYFLHVK